MHMVMLKKLASLVFRGLYIKDEVRKLTNF
jgi:hypothetical protein